MINVDFTVLEGWGWPWDMGLYSVLCMAMDTASKHNYY